MDIELLSDKNIVAHDAPLTERVEADVVLWLNISSLEPAKDRLLASADTCILAHENQANTCTLLFINRVLEARHQRDDNGAAPVFIVLMSSDDTFNQGVTDTVNDSCVVGFSTRDEELVLHVDKVIRLLDHLDVGILDAVLSLLNA